MILALKVVISVLLLVVFVFLVYDLWCLGLGVIVFYVLGGYCPLLLACWRISLHGGLRDDVWLLVVVLVRFCVGIGKVLITFLYIDVICGVLVKQICVYMSI